MKDSMKLWLKLTRPGTLAAGAAPVLIGLMVVYKEIDLKWLVAGITLLTSITIQIASNFINDYYDYKKGLDKTGRLGPRRALAEGKITPRALLLAIIIDLLITIIGGLYLVYIGGLPILLIGASAIFCAWLYTATPYSLSYLGIADFFVLVFFGPVATVGTSYLQTGEFSMQSFWLGLVCGMISMAVLTVNNMRDREGDKAAGKRSLVVRFGKRFGELEYLCLFLLIAPCLYLASVNVLPYAIVVYGISLYVKLKKTEGRDYNKLLVMTGQANLLFVFFLALDYFIFTNYF